jgi:hypothetical protein
MIQDVSSISQDKWRLYTSWQIISDPDPGFESYNIYRSATEDGVYTLRGSTASGDRTVDYYSDAVLENDDYYYRIASEDQDGNISVLSDSIHAIANAIQDAEEGGGGSAGDTTSPTIETGPTVTTTTSNSATITWTTNEDSDSYIEYGTTISYGEVFGSSGVRSSHSVTLPENLSGNTTYHYRVRTRDSAGNLTTSSDGTFTTEPGGDTTPPVITSTTTGTPNPTNITITWTTDENANSLVDFGTTQGVYTLTQGSSVSATTSHSVTLTSLTPNTQYFYQVKSQDSSGNQATDDNTGASYTFTTAEAPDLGDTTAPTISDITVSGETATGATISWTTNEPADSIVGFSLDESYTQEQGSSDLNTSHSVTLTGLSPSSTYYFQVKSRDESGNLATTTDSATQTFTTNSGEDTTPPVILSGPTISSITSTGATVTWTTNENSNSLVNLGTESGTYTGTQGNDNDSLTNHSITLTNLTPGETYYLQVKSRDSNSNTATSGEESFATLASPTISGVTLDSNTDTTATISFTTDQNAYGYIDYGTTTGVYTESKGGLTLTDSHSINLTGLTPATEYFYQVRVRDIYGNYILDATENSFTTNSGDAPTLSSFTSDTGDGYYKESDTINLIATYSEAISSGSITVELDTGSEVELTGTGTTLTGTYTIQAGENSSDLTVSRIVVQNVCDSDSNCLTGVTLPATNIATVSDIVVDTTNPTISGFSPTTSSTVSTDNFGYTLDETITSGTLTVIRTGGTADGSSPHTYTLSGTDLTSGAHSSIDPTITLTNGAVYTFELTVADLAGNSTTETQTNITYDTDSFTLNSFSSDTEDNIYGPDSTINLTATYSKDLISGELTVTLDTGATVTLDTIIDNTISGTYTVGATGSGENSTDLTVTAITAETVQDSLGTTPTSAVPATNINTASAIVVDTTAPTFTITSPTNNSTINSLTTSSNLSYSIDENLTSGSIEISLVSGTDTTSLYTCTLSGAYLNAGDYTNFNTTNCTEGAITLTNESVYNFTFNGEDIAGNSNTQTITGVEYNLAPTITISGVTETNLTDDSATITFTTTPNAYGYIDYGTTTGVYTESKGGLTLTTSHSVNLTGLTPATEYFYQVRVRDIYGNYTLDDTENSFTTNSGDSPTLNSFTSTTGDGYYKESDTINVTATYSEAITTGSITVELDTGSEVELTGTGTTLTGTYTINSGENSSDLTVERIVVQNVCDADSNCLTNVTLPASNLADTSALVVDTTNPTISAFSPVTDSTVATDNFSYTLDENIATGVLTVTQTGGTADSTVHNYTLTGTDLDSGVHTNLDPAMTLTNGAVYTFELLLPT